MLCSKKSQLYLKETHRPCFKLMELIWWMPVSTKGLGSSMTLSRHFEDFLMKLKNVRHTKFSTYTALLYRLVLSWHKQYNDETLDFVCASEFAAFWGTMENVCYNGSL